MGNSFSRLKASSAQIALAVTLSLGLGVSTLVPSDAEAQTIQLNQIIIDGNQRIASETIITLAGLDVRRVYTQGEVNAAIQRLVRTGFFETVDVNIAGNRATIIVDEKPTINRVAFEGNRRRKDEELQTVVDSQPREIFSASQAESDANSIARAYEVNGRIKATVTPRIIERSDNRVDLVFEILEGRVSEIERIAFEGNRRFSDARLRSALDSRQAGAFRQLTTRDVFIDERMTVDEANIRRFYTNRGYVDARVISSTSDITREADAFLVTYTVEEGQQYRFGEINIVPNTGDIDPAEYRGVIKRLRPGKIYDPREIDSAVADLEAQLNEDGYPFIAVQPVPTRNADDLTIALDIEVNMADRLFIERIEISGNGSTQDQVIRREFGLVEGDPFNRRKVQQATDRIRALGFFSNVEVQAREGTKPGSVIIDVVVEEQPTGSFGVGGSYSSSGGFAANISVRERNLLGRGLSFRFDISNASENTTIGIGLTNPSFRGRDVSLGFDLGQTSQSVGEINMDRTNLSGSVTLGFPLGEDSNLLTSAFFRNEDITLQSGATPGTDVSTTAAVDVTTSARLSGGIRFVYTLDRSNSIVNPTSGYVLQFTQEFSGGDKKFSKSIANFTTYRRLRGEDITLRLELEGGHLIYSGGSSIITDRFFLGGDSLIGFSSRGIGPRDTAVATNDALGGNSYFVARAELGFPLGNLESVGISGGVFVNAGTVWGLDSIQPGTTLAGDDRSIRVSAGFTVFWDTPIGPLRFDFARPLVHIEGIDETENFRFSISSQF